jgi:hypothetical protein
MKLRELLHHMKVVQQKIGAAEPYICGGTPRDRFMDRLDNIADIDITTGDKTVDYLSQEFYLDLRKEYNATRTTANDGHSTIHLGSFKMDFSSNFNVPGIEQMLINQGIKAPTNMQKEMFSRDFTCNALLLDFDLKNVVDPTHRGFRDIKERVIRTCLRPEITLTNSKNRVIRAVYLAAKLDFNLDPAIIAYVQQHPEVVKVATNKVMVEKMNEAFRRDPDKASHLLTQMNLWNQVPIPEAVVPYYQKHLQGNVKKAYFQGGGGVNLPTPGKPKYKVEPSITVQPRFVEPFYRNYDLYDVEGLNGPAKHGPGSGWNHMDEFKSVKDFLDFRRQKLKGKYVAEDTYITEQNHQDREDRMKLRADLLHGLTKTAADENDGPNFDYGDGAYTAMSEGKKIKTITDAPHKSPGAFFADDNEDHMMPPKEHGTGIYDWKNSPYQNLKKNKSITQYRKKHDKKYHADDVSQLDFPIDEQVTPIIGDSESYQSPIQLGPSGPADTTISPNQVNLGDTEDYPNGAQLGGWLDKYLPHNDFDDKTPADLDFGRDYTDEFDYQGGRPYSPEDQPKAVKEHKESDKLNDLEKKYLSPAPTHGLYGLPDGVDLPDEDLGDPTNINPDFGTTDVGVTMYEDKWNI